MLQPDEPNIDGVVPGPLTAERAAELFGVIAHPDRLRIIGLVIAAQSVSLDELEAVVEGDRAVLIAHLDALIAERILALTEVDGVVQVSARSPYTDDFVTASRAWLTDLLGGPVVKA
ncbi:MAG: helix-turn-helix domain-containing protein [Yonghaparkia sp.]|nr:helix-turn-helix domain-containing protein [Microcella sp.]